MRDLERELWRVPDRIDKRCQASRFSGKLLCPAVQPPEEMTMTHPNEDLVRRGYQAFQTGDIDTLRTLYDPDIMWHMPGNNLVSGEHKGLDAVLKLFGSFMDLTGGTLRVDLHDVLANDSHAVGLHTATAERGGRQLHGDVALVIHIRDGRISEIWHMEDDQAVWDRFWA
jgi:uncharacterized protein